jgi:hypothetical protein
VPLDGSFVFLNVTLYFATLETGRRLKPDPVVFTYGYSVRLFACFGSNAAHAQRKTGVMVMVSLTRKRTNQNQNHFF